MIVLQDSDILRVSLDNTPTLGVTCYVNYADNNIDVIDNNVVTLNTSGYTTVLSSPAPEDVRVIKSVHIYNPGAPLIVIVAANDSVNNRVLKYAPLATGRSLSYDARGWYIY